MTSALCITTVLVLIIQTFSCYRDSAVNSPSLPNGRARARVSLFETQSRPHWSRTKRIRPIRMIDSNILREARYTHCYCEENIYLLGRSLLEQTAIDETEYEVYVVFISNETKSVLLCQGRNSTQDLVLGHSAVVWDYHVILILYSLRRGSFVYDFDSKLAFGSSFTGDQTAPCFTIVLGMRVEYPTDYFRATFPFSGRINTRYQSLFRVISLANYLNYFASNRSHMISPFGQSETLFLSPPPEYPKIKGPLATTNNNLFASYVEMSTLDCATNAGTLSVQWKTKIYGEVMDSRVFFRVFGNCEGSA